jgi:hypothetical protein
MLNNMSFLSRGTIGLVFILFLNLITKVWQARQRVRHLQKQGLVGLPIYLTHVQ